MKKIKLNEIKNRASIIDSAIVKNVKGGAPNFSGDCAEAYYAACGWPGCKTGPILAALKDAGIC